MEKSSITKLSGYGSRAELATRLGMAIRQRRRQMGLTQTELGRPLTKGFVSEVERGRSLPSLAALTLLAERLAVPVGVLLGEVNEGLPIVYTAPNENEYPAAASHDRQQRSREPDRRTT
jgi:transcriptional regulator with XRE-family HTH domain